MSVAHKQSNTCVWSENLQRACLAAQGARNAAQPATVASLGGEGAEPAGGRREDRRTRNRKLPPQLLEAHQPPPPAAESPSPATPPGARFRAAPHRDSPPPHCRRSAASAGRWPSPSTRT